METKYRIQQYIDNSWQSVADAEFGDAETAQNAIDELRQHAPWTMAQLQVKADEDSIPIVEEAVNSRDAGWWRAPGR